jgi:hypothetical protein
MLCSPPTCSDCKSVVLMVAECLPKEILFGQWKIRDRAVRDFSMTRKGPSR